LDSVARCLSVGGKTMTYFSIKTRTQFRMPVMLVRPGSRRWGHPSLPLARLSGSGCRTLRRTSLRTPGRRCVALALECRAARSRRGHRKSAVLSSRPSCSCHLAPEREGQVVVAIPQPSSARAESVVVFLQKEIGGIWCDKYQFEERIFDSLQQEI
jgi:hypothetical protein